MSADATSSSIPVSFRLPTDEGLLVQELKSYVTRHRDAMAERIRAGSKEGGLVAGKQLTRALDGLLCALFSTVRAVACEKGCWVPTSLMAVGSYGRCSLSFHSDLDVRLLAADEHAAGTIAEALLYPLWDAGITIGHQVISEKQVLELAETDVPTATSLLDLRLISGEPEPLKSLDDAAFASLFGSGSVGRFLGRMEKRAVERVERYGGSVYLLEPDVRNGPGGLRDFDVFHWIARARWRVKTPRDLVQFGVLIPREWEPIETAVNFLAHVRNLLHLYGGRRNDRLSFERQEQVSADLGYGTDGPAVERFMSEYYRHARVLSQARDMLAARAEPPPTRKPHYVQLAPGLKLINDQVTLSDPVQLDHEPALALRLYMEAVRRGVQVYPFARSVIARAATSSSFCERLRNDTEASRLFVKLCSWVPASSFDGGSVLRELHDVGLLTAMVPEFIPVIGRVHHDVYHVYTVDVHSVEAVDRLRKLCRGELAQEFPLASRLAAEVARPNVLFFATLLHDVGKDIGGTEHGERGAVLAEPILARLHFSVADVREVQHLIRQHLKMYHVATRRDVDDPRTIEEFVREVHGHEGLRELYLLTVCDVGTTSQESLTSWKSRMLDELYVAAETAIDEGRAAHGGTANVLREEVLRAWPGDKTSMECFLDAMPERYLFANEPSRIVSHAEFAIASRGKSASVGALSLNAPYAEFAFVADDRPGLLALIAASIAAAHVEVQAAQIYSFIDVDGIPRVFDLFWVQAGDRVVTGKTLSARFERELLRLLGGELTAIDLLSNLRPAGRWSMRAPSVGTEISVDNRGSSRCTIVEVIARDRMGLLFSLASAIQSLDLVISLAKINTEGTQVADVFYVTEVNGGKVTDSERISALKRRILEAVGSP